MAEGKLDPEEKETIFLFNEKENICRCDVFRRSLITKMDKLCAERPKECKLVGENKTYGLKQYEFPKNWLKIRATHPRGTKEV